MLINAFKGEENWEGRVTSSERRGWTGGRGEAGGEGLQQGWWVWPMMWAWFVGVAGSSSLPVQSLKDPFLFFSHQEELRDIPD